MGNPRVKVTIQAIISDAEVWSAAAEDIKKVNISVEELRINYLNAGIFFPMVEPYRWLCDFISDRTQEGNLCMSDISERLRKCAKYYGQNEDQIKESVDGAY